MTNTKRRGNWGEYQLDYLLGTYLGENDSIYSTQYTLPNGKIADVALHLPGTKQVLCIDSKFPMENFMRMDDDPESRDYYLRLFMQNIKKHIDDISNKYINAYTAPQALMFIPSEAIYQFVCGNCDSLFSYALQKTCDADVANDAGGHFVFVADEHERLLPGASFGGDRAGIV